MPVESGQRGVACRSSIAFGEVAHWRAEPRQHSFSYPIFTFQFDVDELDAGSVLSKLVGAVFFRVNARAIFSVREDDYLRGPGNFRQRVERVLQEVGVVQSPHRITLITMPRYFGYVFNPVSFFACFDANECVVAFVTQVNNTFGETHVYPLVCEATPLPKVWRFSKEFFVSPFFDREGDYEVILRGEGKELSVEVNLEKDKKRAFSATLAGKAEPISRRRFLRTLANFPLTTFLTMPRIHLQAMTLYFAVRTCPFRKPTPIHPYTIRSRQNIIHRSRLALLSVMKWARTPRP